MMQLRYNPVEVPAQIELPRSKSIALRVMILNIAAEVLGKGYAEILHLPDSEDVEGMTRAITALRAGESSVYIGEGGAPIRFFTALMASLPGREMEITASEGLMKRPMKLLIDALREAGAEIKCIDREGYPPLRIKGRELSAKIIHMNHGVSSQYISALMMAAPLWTGNLHLLFEEGEVVSRPYIEMTRRIMERFDIAVEWDENEVSVSGEIKNVPVQFDIETDWSAASYFYEICAIRRDPAWKIHIRSLTPPEQSLQGDSACMALFEHLGVKTEFLPDGSTILQYDPAIESNVYSKVYSDVYSGGTPCLRVDMGDCPDLVPALSVACALTGRCFRFEGVAHLRLKETDRMAAIAAELRKLGIEIECGADYMRWDGRKAEIAPSAAEAPEARKAKRTAAETPRVKQTAAEAPEIATYSDHRMAMAFAPAVILYPGLKISNPEVVRKSYPRFWQSIASLGLTTEASEVSQSEP